MPQYQEKITAIKNTWEDKGYAGKRRQLQTIGQFAQPMVAEFDTAINSAESNLSAIMGLAGRFVLALNQKSQATPGYGFTGLENELKAFFTVNFLSPDASKAWLDVLQSDQAQQRERISELERELGEAELAKRTLTEERDLARVESRGRGVEVDQLNLRFADLQRVHEESTRAAEQVFMEAQVTNQRLVVAQAEVGDTREQLVTIGLQRTEVRNKLTEARTDNVRLKDELAAEKEEARTQVGAALAGSAAKHATDSAEITRLGAELKKVRAGASAQSDATRENMMQIMGRMT